MYLSVWRCSPPLPLYTLPILLHQAAGMSEASSNNGIAGGTTGVAIVRRCLDTLGDVLGQPALRVMTQLVMAGEDLAAL